MKVETVPVRIFTEGGMEISHIHEFPGNEAYETGDIENEFKTSIREKGGFEKTVEGIDSVENSYAPYENISKIEFDWNACRSMVKRVADSA